MAGSGDVKATVAESGEGERAVAGSGEGAVAGSGHGERAVAGSGKGERAVAGSGKRGRAPLKSLDYPCTKLLRLRRLLGYLGRHGYEDVYQAANGRMRAIFHVRDLVKQVRTGQLQEAFTYVNKFAPIHRSSYQATILSLFLQDFMAINDIANGHTGAAGFLCHWFKSIYKQPVLAKYPCFATLVEHVLFLHLDPVRTFLDWQLVRNKAAQLVEAIVYRTPELSVRLHFPHGRSNLSHVVPIGSSFRRRRQVKNLGRKKSTDVAEFYLHLKKTLPSSGQKGCHCSSAGTPKGQGEALMALLDKALQAGRRPELEEGYPLEYLSKVFPLEAMLTIEAMPQLWSIQGYRPEHSSKRDMSKNPAVVSPPQIFSAMKRSRFQDSHRDSLHPVRDSKRPRTTGNFHEFRRAGKAMGHQPGCGGL